MKDKRRGYFCQVINAGIIAGIIILFIGLYYFMIKAGIPYQEPPLDLWIQYQVNAGIGERLMEIGFKVAMCSGVVRFLLRWI